MISKKILASIVIIGLLALAMGWGTYSWFFDKETSTGNTFSAGTIDLAVYDPDSQQYENPFEGVLVKLENMLPSEWAYRTVWIKNVGTREGDAWLHLSITDWGNGIPWWIDFDLKVDEEVVIHPDDGITLAHIRSCWIPLGRLDVNQALKIELSFHLKGETPNDYNGDSCTFNIDFYLNQPGAPPPPSNRILLENKNPQTWEPVLGDGIWGIAEYHTSDLTLEVWAFGLTPNAYHQICLNSQPANEGETKKIAIASALASGIYDGTSPGTAPAPGYNLYQRLYWKDGPSTTWSSGAEGIFNVEMFAQADDTGYLHGVYTAKLPDGDYEAIKFIIKEAIEANPPDNYGTEWPGRLMECWVPLYFTIP